MRCTQSIDLSVPPLHEGTLIELFYVLLTTMKRLSTHVNMIEANFESEGETFELQQLELLDCMKL